MSKNKQYMKKTQTYQQPQLLEAGKTAVLVERIINKAINENIDIEDVIYCGQMDFEIDGELKKKDVFLMKKNVDGSIKWEYYADGDRKSTKCNI